MQKTGLFARLVRGAGAALAVQIFSAVTVYSSQVLLARWMGTAEYGIYDYANSISIVGAFIAGFGLPTAALRFISAYNAQGDWAHLSGMIGGSWRQLLIASCFVSCGGTAIWLRLNAEPGLGAYAIPLLLGIWTIPSLTLINLQREVIRGFQQIILSFSPSLILQPLLLVIMAAVWRLQQDLNSTILMMLSLLSVLVALAIQWQLFQQNLDARIRHTRPVYEVAKWWKVALPLMLLDGSHMILSHTDTLMIGAFLSAREVGIYSAALKTSAWVPFILKSINAVAAPLIASLYAQGDRQGLQQLISTIARWMFYPALVTAMGLIYFAQPVLQLFGPEFIAAKGALIVLILGQLVNVGAGSVGYLMTMTGYQNQSALVMVVSALANVILNLMGIHFFGIIGAAIATALSMAIWNIWLYSLVVQKLGVRPSILDAFRANS